MNRRLDREDLAPDEPAGIIGIIVRLAMDGLWVSDILDDIRFSAEERRRITNVLSGMTRLTDRVLGDLLTGMDPAPGS